MIHSVDELGFSSPKTSLNFNVAETIRRTGIRHQNDQDQPDDPDASARPKPASVCIMAGFLIWRRQPLTA
jgi:hypothetical protein